MYILVFALAAGVAIYIRSYIFNWFFWRGNRKMHEEMIDRVFNAPVNTYFDATSTTRISKRFTRDLVSAETGMVWFITRFFDSFQPLIASFVFAAIECWQISLIFPALMIINFYYFQKLKPPVG